MEGCSPEHAFERIEVPFQPYSRTATPETAPSKVFTYVALRAKVATAGLPSRRYLDLLITTACSAQLDPAYIGWLKAQPSFSVESSLMPSPSLSERCRTVTPEELRAHRYRETASASAGTWRSGSAGGSGGLPLVPAPAWVCLGGQVFDLNAHAVARAPSPREPMIRYMALSQDATAFVLRILARAYPQEEPTRALGELSERQRAHVAAWANFLVMNACPRIGVLAGADWSALLSSGSGTSRDGSSNGGSPTATLSPAGSPVARGPEPERRAAAATMQPPRLTALRRDDPAASPPSPETGRLRTATRAGTLSPRLLAAQQGGLGAAWGESERLGKQRRAAVEEEVEIQ